MPSLLHEALIEMFKARPMLAAELLEAARVLAPNTMVRGQLLDAQLNQVVPTEYRADALLMLEGTSALAAIVEVQLRPDPEKLWIWAVYLTAARAKLRCPVVLLVVTLDADTEVWASKPIELGPGSVIRPVVLGPRHVPVITDPKVAVGSPELAVLSAIVHGKEPVAAEIGRAALEAALTLDEARSQLYADLILLSVHDAARQLLERLMLQDWEPQSDFFKGLVAKYAAKARAEGRELGLERGRELGLEQGRELGLEQGHLAGQRDLLSRQLTRRFGPLPDDIRARLDAAGDEQLARWGEELLFVDSLGALFGS